MWPTPHPPVTLADGRRVTLLRVTYGTRHRCTYGPVWVRALGPLLPDRWKRKGRGGTLRVETPEPTLMVWAAWDHVSVTNQAAGLAAIGDGTMETGPVYAEAWGSISPAQPITGWVFRQYPRRRAALEMRLLDVFDKHVSALLTVDNPEPSDAPQWEPKPLPQTCSLGDHELTLQEWIRPPLDLEERLFITKDPPSQLRFTCPGASAHSLHPFQLTVKDATGNLWEHPLFGQGFDAKDTLVVELRQPLWRAEHAYHLRLELLEPEKPATPHRLSSVPIPAAQTSLTNVVSDERLRLDQLRCRQQGVLADRTVEAIFTFQRGRLEIINVTDQAGNTLELTEMPMAARDQLYFRIVVPAPVQSLTFNFQPMQSHQAEFLVAPPQASRVEGAIDLARD